MKRVFGMALALVLAVSSLAQAMSISGLGGGVNLEKIEGKSIYTYHVAFSGGEIAQVRVHGYGNTFLGLAIYDSQGKLVDLENDRAGGDCLATWIPGATQLYTVKVVNPAPISNTYWISTN